MKLKYFFKHSFFDYYEFFKFCFFKIKTNFWFGLFLSHNGKGNCIIKPILITPSCISLGNCVLIRNGCRIEGIRKHENVNYSPSIIFHDNVVIEQNAHITCAQKIEIGAKTSIAANVTITDIDHPYSNILEAPQNQKLAVRPVEIGENCKIYNNVIILPGVQIGNHTVVAANSVVLGKKYPDFVLLAGVPAKIIKKYDSLVGQWIKL